MYIVQNCQIQISMIFVILYKKYIKYKVDMDSHSPYCDLSIITQKAIDIAYFLKKVKNNGYSTVALDVQITDPKQNTYQNKMDPKWKDLEVEGLKIYKRITLVIENSVSLHPLGQQQAPFQCDILAIKPLNQKIFHSICTEYDSYDIITFDIANKLPFMLKRNPVYEAIRKGKHFQVFYQPMFDETKRVVAMTNMVNIIKATGGKNLIVSSHASDGSTHRTPYDVAALLISLGLDKCKALTTIKQNCQQVIRNGQHRLYLKGAIQQITPTLGVKLNKRIQKHRQNIKKIQKQKQKQKEMKDQNK